MAGAYVGVFANRTSPSLAQLTSGDGTSNTALFGEYLGDADTGPRQLAGCWMGVGALPAAWGLDTGARPRSGWYMFTSRHSGIVQFCFGDGSVRGLRKGQSPGSGGWYQYVYASGWHDGQVVDFTAISN